MERKVADRRAKTRERWRPAVEAETGSCFEPEQKQTIRTQSGPISLDWTPGPQDPRTPEPPVALLFMKVSEFQMLI